MQNLQDLQEKIFFEAKNILDVLSKIETKEELLSKQDSFAELMDRIAFLRILEKNKESFNAQSLSITGNNQDFELNSNERDSTYFEDSPLEEDVIEEEVLFTNELNDIDNEAKTQSFNATEAIEIEEKSDENALKINNDEVDEPEINSQEEQEFLEMEEKRRKIVEFNKREVEQPVVEEYFSNEQTSEHPAERKFKLANIKGLKAVQNLFDEDPLEEIQEKEIEVSDDKLDSGSLLKSNIATDFMEAPKKIPEFRLDLNDKVAFTKLLFNGDENELKLTIEKLNSFDSLDDAKQYLSEIYYLKDWKKADDYAQRLWNLVESKF